ncbi:formate dehydrogenase subunit delta [Reyranella aquatilis]|uniref:Formate dehydrogenase subunit delta n=2 Tax=Reyranella aquatilis TaxID=2035356 RepID=A0ABS8KRB4_9HYPH|nr:formate dehydrogenase subunit delta [uncultured Reyranella sp.]MCC8428612.1 formate dehydrogenase subunit delta [Reyranella aquatilis]
MSVGKLVTMANQIGRFFTPQRGIDAPLAIATHLLKFWPPSMRDAIVGHLDGGGEGLDPAVRQAVLHLKEGLALGRSGTELTHHERVGG